MTAAFLGLDHPYAAVVIAIVCIALFCVTAVIFLLKDFDKKKQGWSGPTEGKKTGKRESKKLAWVIYELYPDCPKCSAEAKQGGLICKKCGKSLVKSRRVIADRNKQQYKLDSKRRTEDGMYPIDSVPNGFLHMEMIPEDEWSKAQGNRAEEEDKCI